MGHTHTQFKCTFSDQTRRKPYTVEKPKKGQVPHHRDYEKGIEQF